ncbi:MAG: T9SS type A sorting domain-containing protein [Bacteroidetes bacterium]|nr:T9SS type A sorting domain-containing protein [Bacteroidota bacterium]
MRRYLLFCLSVLSTFLPRFVLAQADNCNTPATTLTVYPAVCTPYSGSTTGATPSSGPASTCGSTDDDVWFRYTTAAGSSYAFLYVDPASSGFDPAFQALSGACGSQAVQACVDAYAGGQGESVTLTGLSGSTTYYIRVFSYGSGSGTDGSFTACVFNGAPPANDVCGVATSVTLTQNATCSPTAGTTAWATTSAGIPACVGTADDDVWYKFTTGAGVTYERIVVDPTGSGGADLEFDPVVQVFSGTCGAFVSIACQNAVGAGGTEDFFVSGLTGSTTYYVRVYHYGSWYANRTDGGSFDICVMGGSPPANDNCAGALALPTNPGCVVFGGSSTTTFATQSSTGTPCSGYSIDDDVWYSFVAINYTHTLTVDPNSAMNVQIQVLSGACGSILSEQCQDNAGIDGTETMVVTGLTIGNTYYVRISHNGTFYGSNGSFTICNVASAPVGGDDLCNAVALPAVTSACTYGTYDNSSMPTGSGALPAGCSERANGFRRHMWFKFVVPTGGKVSINVKGLTGNITNPTVAAFSWNGGACGTLTNFTLLSCNNDFCNVNGDCNYHSVLNLSGLSVGATTYFKVSSASTDNGAGTFKICVSAPLNDGCPAPLFVCDLNGFEGTTSAGYTIDNGGLEGWSGGPYGTGGTTIENNSWLQFEASDVNASITITVSDCYLDDGGAGEYQYNCCGGPAGFNGGGLQAQILAMNGGNCSGSAGWTAMSVFLNGINGPNFGLNGTYTVTNTSALTVGQIYYIMFDGFAGDVCNYKINAATGVGTTVIVTPPSSTTNICSGSTATLAINPVGSGGTVNWSSSPSGYVCNNCGSSVVVDPAASPGVTDGTVTYYATVSGNCITPQTVSATVNVEPTPPTPTVVADPPGFCGVTSVSMTASAANATDYEWFDALVGGNSLDVGPVFTPAITDNQIGSYTVYVAAYNTSGSPTCTTVTRATKTVTINAWDGKIKWTGNAPAATPNWTNTLNWAGCTPGCADAVGVIIPDQTTVPGPNDWPVISSSVTTDSLKLEPNGKLEFIGGALSICGSFGHFGIITISGGVPTITFNGTTKQFYIKTSTGTGDLPNVVINNAAGVRVVDGAGNKDMDIGTAYILTLTNGILTSTNTRTVNVKNSAVGAVTGFGTSSYVAGRLQRAITGGFPKSYDFPVGTSSGYELMNINFTAGTTITSATVYFEKPSNALGTGLSALSEGGASFITTVPGIVDAGGGTNGGLWTVLASGGVANYDMTLYGRIYSNAGGFTHTIVKRDPFCPGNWTLSGTYGGSSVGGGIITVTRTGMNGFSQFGIGRHDAVFPISLLFFNAVCTSRGIELSWITASEINNDYFTIERAAPSQLPPSGEGMNWTVIGTVKGAGNSSTIRKYEFTDPLPDREGNGGAFYYRLKQTDFDGTHEYFDAVPADCNSENEFKVINIIPNPAKDNIYILFSSGKKLTDVTIVLFDVLGNYVIKEKFLPIEGFNSREVDLSFLNNGVYVVNVNNGTTNFIQRIVRQD